MAAVKNVKHVYYITWMHLRILNQNLWNKRGRRGVKNMTIRHTSRRVVAPTVVQSSDGKRQLPPRAAVSLPQAGGSEVVILWSTLLHGVIKKMLYLTVVGLHDMVLAQALALATFIAKPIDNNFPSAGVRQRHSH